jgi:hypothetical protein
MSNTLRLFKLYLGMNAGVTASFDRFAVCYRIQMNSGARVSDSKKKSEIVEGVGGLQSLVSSSTYNTRCWIAAELTCWIRDRSRRKFAKAEGAAGFGGILPRLWRVAGRQHRRAAERPWASIRT